MQGIANQEGLAYQMYGEPLYGLYRENAIGVREKESLVFILGDDSC